MISLITTLVNVFSTPIAFWIVERLGRRTILIYGATGMIIMQFIVGIIGATAGKTDKHNNSAVSAMIAFICLNISFFAATWGPCSLGCHWRDLPSYHPVSWCWPVYRIQLVLELRKWIPALFIVQQLFEFSLTNGP